MTTEYNDRPCKICKKGKLYPSTEEDSSPDWYYQVLCSRDENKRFFQCFYAPKECKDYREAK